MTNAKFVRNGFSARWAMKRFCKQQVVRWAGLMRARFRLVAGFCLLAGIQALAQTGQFVVPPQYAVAGAPYAVAVGDFNGDGKLDLAVGNGCTSVCYVSILLGNGDGTFQTHVDYPVGTTSSTGLPLTPLYVGVGDFNGDGKLDLVVVNNASDTVSVLFGNGDGTFQNHVDYPTGSSPSSVVVGDFNGDGKPDLAVAVSGGVSIYLNSGTGTFPTRKDFDLGSGFVYLAVGDLNKDGKLDLAAIDCPQSCQSYNSPGSVAILLGNGDGTFQAPVNYAVGVSPDSIAVADLNGDGALDLAVANSPAQAGYNHWPVAGSVSMLFGNGDGTFQPQQVYPTGLAPTSVVVGDFNGDGQLDFAVTNEMDGTVGVYLNQGHGTFSQPTVFYGTGGNGVAAAAGDFNGDQKLDLALAVPPGVSVLLGKGDGSFAPTSLSYPTGSNPSAVAMADLNVDGKNDVVVTNSGDNNVSVFMGNGDGTLQPRVNYTTGNGPSSVAIADLNGDGKPDLVVANQTDNTVSVLLNNGNGTFQGHVDYPTAVGPVSVAIGDFNGDGKLDLAIACLGSSPAGSSVSILLGNGDGTFQGHTDYDTGNGENALGASIALGDFNGDGKLDFAVVETINNDPPFSQVDVFLNNGDGSFKSTVILLFCTLVPGQPPYPCESQVFVSIAAADFNGDGKLDLAVSGLSSAPFEVLLGGGDGTFQQVFVPSLFNVGAAGGYIAVGDFNGDGIPDVALGQGQYALLLLGNGDDTFRSGSANYTGDSQIASQVTAGDLNGDGKPDLAVANGVSTYGNGYGVSNTLTILLNTGKVASSFKLALSPASQTVDAGNSANFAITATTANGFTGVVTISCPQNIPTLPPLPPGATCIANPASIIPTASGASAIVTVTTSAATDVGTYPLGITGTLGPPQPFNETSEQFTVYPSLRVNPAAPDFSISAPSSTTPNPVTPGQSAKATVTVGSTGGFAGAVAFSCKVSPAPALAPVCSLNPAQGQVTNGGQVTSTLTVNTTAPTSFLTRPSLGHAAPPIYAIVFPIFGLALVGAGFTSGGRRRKRLLGLVIGSVLFGGLVFQAACAGVSSSTPVTPSTPGTPAGNYTVSVTASSGSTQHTTSLMLTVQ